MDVPKAFWVISAVLALAFFILAQRYYASASSECSVVHEECGDLVSRPYTNRLFLEDVCPPGRTGRNCLIDVPPDTCIPSFLIVGVTKGGTTSLHFYLTQNPSIMPVRKFYFFDKEFHLGLPYYFGKFRDVKHRYQICGTGAPRYLYHPEVPERIFPIHPNGKIIALLRDPVGRLWSSNNMIDGKSQVTIDVEKLTNNQIAFLEECLPDWQACWRKNETFMNDARLVGKGMYYYILLSWLRFFKPEQMLLIKSEEFFSNTQTILDQINQFIGVPSFNYSTEKVMNQSKKPRPMPDALRKLARKFYEPHNQKLYALLKEQFNITHIRWDYSADL